MACAPVRFVRPASAGGARAHRALDRSRRGVPVPESSRQRRPHPGGARAQPASLSAGDCPVAAMRQPRSRSAYSSRPCPLTHAHGASQLATTLDDSIGDAFDKVGRALQLPWAAQGQARGTVGRAAARRARALTLTAPRDTAAGRRMVLRRGAWSRLGAGRDERQCPAVCAPAADARPNRYGTTAGAAGAAGARGRGGGGVERRPQWQGMTRPGAGVVGGGKGRLTQVLTLAIVGSKPRRCDCTWPGAPGTPGTPQPGLGAGANDRRLIRPTAQVGWRHAMQDRQLATGARRAARPGDDGGRGCLVPARECAPLGTAAGQSP